MDLLCTIYELMTFVRNEVTIVIQNEIARLQRERSTFLAKNDENLRIMRAIQERLNVENGNNRKTNNRQVVLPMTTVRDDSIASLPFPLEDLYPIHHFTRKLNMLARDFPSLKLYSLKLRYSRAYAYSHWQPMAVRFTLAA